MAEVAEFRRVPAETPEGEEERKQRIRDRRSLALLLSLVLFLVLLPVLDGSELGELVVIVSLYAMLVTAVMQLATYTGNRWWIPLTVVVAGTSMAFILLAHFKPTRVLTVSNQCLLILFFSMIAVRFFTALGQPGSITKARLYASVSLYLILGMGWFTLYRLIYILDPGSFVIVGEGATVVMTRTTLLYLSFATLTTVGYGDVVPVAPLARMFAVMEAAAGVLYVAFTIARLVSAYQGPSHHRK
jgi:hypothetical protein